MNRAEIYSQMQGRSWDFQSAIKDTLIGLAYLYLATAGSDESVVSGFDATPTSPASLSINLTAGQIYMLAAIDATQWGTIPPDSTQIMQQGFAAAQQITLVNSLTGTQRCWALVQCTFSQPDGIRPGDPNPTGVYPFFNAQNPSNPFQGPGNGGGSLPDVRNSVATVSVVYGTPLSSGTPVPPTPSGNNVPMYLILLQAGQTTVTTIPVAGPGVYSGYPQAPFLAGLLNSHHGGIPGQAPKINLGTETTGNLGLGQLPATNSSGGLLPVQWMNGLPGTTVTGNPNGQLAGGLGDRYWDTVNQQEWICSSAGPASGAGQAVWQAIGSNGLAIVVTSNFSVGMGNITYLVDTTSAPITATLPLAAQMNGTLANFIVVGTNALTIVPQSAENIESGAAGASIALNVKSDYAELAPRASVGWYYKARSDYPGVCKLHNTGINIPPGWVLCDGNNGTSNSLGMFIVGARPAGSGSAANGSGFGVVGPGSQIGANSHSHTFTIVATTQSINNLGIQGANNLSLGNFGHNHIFAYSGGTDNSGFAPSALGYVLIQKQ